MTSTKKLQIQRQIHQYKLDKLLPENGPIQRAKKWVGEPDQIYTSASSLQELLPELKMTVGETIVPSDVCDSWYVLLLGVTV